MSTPKEHTPGPWKWARRYDDAGNPIAVLLETEHRPIQWNDPCVTAVREDWIDQFIEDSPNARLIAAAPEMLEALIVICANIENGENMPRLLNDIRAIIRKATGEGE